MHRLILGCGYLGRRVAAAWAASGDQVSAVTRSVEHAEILSGMGLEPIVADVTRPQTLRKLPEADTVLHAVGFDRQAGPSRRDVYVQGFRNVLTAIPGRCSQLIHISSTGVYGQHNGEEITEDSPAESDHDSGNICRDAERLAMNFSGSTGTPVTVLRLSGIYGPGRLLSRMEAIHAGLKLPGPADAWLNLIHVDDAVTAVLKTAGHPEAESLYLVSDDRPVQRTDYYNILAELLDAPAPDFDSTSVARHIRGIGKRCRNQRMKNHLGVKLQFPTIQTGLPQALGCLSN